MTWMTYCLSDEGDTDASQNCLLSKSTVLERPIFRSSLTSRKKEITAYASEKQTCNS
jgi:hypothetical protein